MVDVLIDVGHGVRSDGKFDPGTVAQDGTREHDQAHIVVGVARAALQRSGVSFDSDDHGTGGLHDTNWSGTVNRASKLRPKCIVEVHFDWSGAPRGGFGIHYPSSTAGKNVAKAIADAYTKRDLSLRYSGTYADTRGLALLKKTQDPAVIWECDKVGAASAEELRKYGEAVAEGICSYVGKRYVPPSQPKPEPTPQPQPEEDIVASLPFINLSGVTRERSTWKGPNKRIRRLQGLLVANGAAPDNTIKPDGTLDGIAGPGTRGALENFQRQAGIGVDAKVGKNTWSKLLGV